VQRPLCSDKQSVFIAQASDYKAVGLYPLSIQGHELLLVKTASRTYLVENKCGHFEIPLEGGEIAGNEIICPAHRISFNLETGEVVNRPYEVCNPIVIYPLEEKAGKLYTRL
jgi:nitrite reductase/ring-hydroxylating ferredoxin subunit